jgi:hypothetical protein
MKPNSTSFRCAAFVLLSSSILVLGVALLASIDATAASFSGVWTARPLAYTPAGGPGARGWVDLIYDPVIGQPVLFGGSGGDYMNDVLDMDLAGSRWVEVEPYEPNVTPYGPPCPRDEHAVEYDSLNRLYWSVGGSGFACGSQTSIVGAGSSSTTIVDPTLAGTTVDFYNDWLVTILPEVPFYTYVSAYDPATKTLTLLDTFPGDPTGLNYTLRPQGGGGTWYYDPATRTWGGFEAPSFGYVGPKPISRLSSALAYSTNDNAMVMFGGSIYNDTWALDAQTKSWVFLRGDGWPGQPARRAQITNSMVYDSRNDAFVLYGGRCADGSGCGSVPYNGNLGDTWVYRLATNTWTQMMPAMSPPPLEQHTMSYDAANGVVVLFGGDDGATFLNDVWVYDVPSNTWTQVDISGDAPEPRRLHAMVYDPAVAEHIVYGGVRVDGSSLADVWSLRLTGAGDVPPIASFLVSPASGDTTTDFLFDASTSRDPDGFIVSYAWDFGDTTAGSGVTVHHSYAVAGTYTVRLTVTDNGGATGSSTAQVVVLSSTHQVSGTVNTRGTPLSGVSLAATGGVTCTNSDAAGRYACTAPQGWSGTVTPAFTGYSFAPPWRSYSGLSADQTAQDYFAAASADTVWVDDAVPAGAMLGSDFESWNWVSSNPTPYVGMLAHQSALVSGMHQHYFQGASATLAIGKRDILSTYVYLDPVNPPREIMLQWYDGSWEHRAYWGANLLAWGIDGSASRRYMGTLPPAGQWVQLTVPAAQVGLEYHTLSGMAYTLYDGRATWDHAGKVIGGLPPPEPPSSSRNAN